MTDKQFNQLLNQLKTISDSLYRIAGVLTTRIPEQGQTIPSKARPAPDNILCPICGNKMIVRRRKSDNTEFYGCSNFPECKGLRPITATGHKPPTGTVILPKEEQETTQMFDDVPF